MTIKEMAAGWAEKEARDSGQLCIRQATEIQRSLTLLRKTLSEVIPDHFQWWFDMDDDLNISVEYIWLGHPNAFPYRVEDTDFSIVIQLVMGINWEEEVKRNLQDISQREGKQLQVAQEERNTILLEEATGRKRLKK